MKRDKLGGGGGERGVARGCVGDWGEMLVVVDTRYMAFGGYRGQRRNNQGLIRFDIRQRRLLYIGERVMVMLRERWVEECVLLGDVVIDQSRQVDLLAFQFRHLHLHLRRPHLCFFVLPFLIFPFLIFLTFPFLA